MRLPTQQATIRRVATLSPPVGSVSARPAQVSIPVAVAAALARDFSIDQITGWIPQCVATVTSILNDYQRCVDSGSNVRCENIAARQIATVACRSYCTCGRS